jgi:tetratricopeptide (TPR) repeat protein
MDVWQDRVALVRARLERIRVEGSIRIALEPAAARESRQLARLLRQMPDDNLAALETRWLLGWLHWYRHIGQPRGRNAWDYFAAVRMFGPVFVNLPGAESLVPETLRSILAGKAVDAADDAMRQVFDASAPELPGALDRAVGLWQRITVSIAADHPSRGRCLTALGAMLDMRFQQSGSPEDLDATIQAYRAGVDATPVRHRDYTARVSNIGCALGKRFEQSGALEDLDAALRACRAAADATPAGHRNRATVLSNLANWLVARFRQSGSLEDLDAAIDALRAAAAAGPGDPLQHFHASVLSNLGVALRIRFERSGSLEDLDAAIDAHRAAAAAIPADHMHYSVILSSFSAALATRGERAESLEDLDAAIDAARATAAVTGPGHADRAMCLTNLGRALGERFKLSGSLENLDAAIDAARAAAAATPADHPQYAQVLSNLGWALERRSRHTGNAAYSSEALCVLAEASAVTAAPPSRRIHAARLAAELAAGSQADRAADLLDTAVRLLPETAPRHIGRDDQQYALSRFPGLASDAAALALADDSPGRAPARADRALRLLESGRAVLLSQALDTRSDVTDLQDSHPDLAARFIQLRDQLDPASGSQAPAALPAGGPGLSLGRQDPDTRHRAAAQFTETLAAIRALDGFGKFLLPPRMRENSPQRRDPARS